MCPSHSQSINSTSPDYICTATLAAHEHDHTKNRYRDIGACELLIN